MDDNGLTMFYWMEWEWTGRWGWGWGGDCTYSSNLVLRSQNAGAGRQSKTSEKLA